jgi:hypothetical protein
MQENVKLRGLIRNLSGFIGEGLGGVLPQMGFDRPQDFMDFMNQAETDTAFEGFQRRKKAAQAAAAAGISNTKRNVSEGDDLSRKRARTNDFEAMGLNGASSSKDSRFPALLAPVSPVAGTSAGTFYPPVSWTYRYIIYLKFIVVNHF